MLVILVHLLACFSRRFTSRASPQCLAVNLSHLGRLSASGPILQGLWHAFSAAVGHTCLLVWLVVCLRLVVCLWLVVCTFANITFADGELPVTDNHGLAVRRFGLIEAHEWKHNQWIVEIGLTRRCAAAT